MKQSEPSCFKHCIFWFRILCVSCADDHPDGAGGVVAPGVLVDAPHAGGAAPRATTVARGGPRPPHSERPPRAPLGPLGIRVRSPGGLRPPHHVGQDHAADPARGRGAVGAGVAAGQVPPAPPLAARLARGAPSSDTEPRHGRLMSAPGAARAPHCDNVGRVTLRIVLLLPILNYIC